MSIEFKKNSSVYNRPLPSINSNKFLCYDQAISVNSLRLELDVIQCRRGTSQEVVVVIIDQTYLLSKYRLVL